MSDETSKKIQRLAEFGALPSDIIVSLGLGDDVATEEAFKAAVRRGLAEHRISICKSIMVAAKGDGRAAGAALVFLAKSRLGWDDRADAPAETQEEFLKAIHPRVEADRASMRASMMQRPEAPRPEGQTLN